MLEKRKELGYEELYVAVLFVFYDRTYGATTKSDYRHEECEHSGPDWISCTIQHN